MIGYPYEGGSWTVGLNTEDVGWVDIDDNVTFDACETSPILTAGGFRDHSGRTWKTSTSRSK